MIRRSERIDDGLSDIQTWMHQIDDPDKGQIMVIENIQDVEPILEQNKRAQRFYSENRQTGDIREVAEIPLIWQHILLEKENCNIWSKEPAEKKKLRRLLDSSEYRHLRTDTSLKLERRL